MKKVIAYGLLLTSFLCLSACHLISNLSSKDKDIAGSISKSTKETEIDRKQQELNQAKNQYKIVFDDYQSMLDYIISGQRAEDATSIAKLMPSLKTGMNYWVAETFLYSPQQQYYAFYDVNQDSQLELLIASQTDEGDFFITGLYTRMHKRPVLLSEGFVAGQGGARSAMEIYQDGSLISYGWSSGTGEAYGELLKWTSNTKEQLLTAEFHVMNDNIHDVFGKTEAETIEFSALDWQAFDASESIETKKKVTVIENMNLEAIMGQDFSSLVGTWKNAKGSVVTIDVQGNVSYQDYPEYTYYVDLRTAKIENGILLASITNPNGRVSASVPTEFIPKGATIFHIYENASDPTDQARDRFFSTQYLMSPEDLVQEVYYRVE